MKAFLQPFSPSRTVVCIGEMICTDHWLTASRKNVVRITDHPDMTSAVYQINQSIYIFRISLTRLLLSRHEPYYTAQGK